MIKIRAAVILQQDGKILLARHRRGNFEYWVIPGGTVEEGETASSAGVREIREETGLAIEILKLAFVSEVIDESVGKHIIDFFFKGSIISGELKKGNDRRLAELKLVPLCELDRLKFYPCITSELKEGLRTNFKGSAKYLGNRNRGKWNSDIT